MSFEELRAMLNMLLALAIVLLLAFFGLRLLLARKPFRLDGAGGMKVLDRLPLGTKSMLCVVRVNQQYFLIAVSETRVELLQQLDYYPEQPSADFSFPGLKKLSSKIGIHQENQEK